MDDDTGGTQNDDDDTCAWEKRRMIGPWLLIYNVSTTTKEQIFGIIFNLWETTCIERCRTSFEVDEPKDRG